MASAVFAGSFDPVTYGHLDLVERGLRLFERVTIAVAQNDSKQPVFRAPERVALIERALDERAIDRTRVDVVEFSGLIVSFAKARGATVLLRGVRTFADYEYELSMARTNHDLAPEIETVFLAPSLGTSYVASRLIRECVRHGADVSHLIPAFVQTCLRERLNASRSS